MNQKPSRTYRLYRREFTLEGFLPTICTKSPGSLIGPGAFLFSALVPNDNKKGNLKPTEAIPIHEQV